MNLCVCVYVSGCDRDLFEETLQMRERRLELEELLAEKKKSAEALKTECDTLAKKVVLLFSLSSHFNIHVYVTMRSFCTTSYCVCVCVWWGADFLALQKKSLRSKWKEARDSLDRDKQQKMNELDVVVPLRLNQVSQIF